MSKPDGRPPEVSLIDASGVTDITGVVAAGGSMETVWMQDPHVKSVPLSVGEVRCGRPGCRWSCMVVGATTDEQLAAYLRHRVSRCPE